MRVGTKSVLFGAHCFFLHPWFVAWAWWQLYGFPWDPRLWVAFFVHDLGYIGLPNMDGAEGEEHPYFGARIMHALFDWPRPKCEWYRFALYHSRFLAKRNGARFSRLCVADKLSSALIPACLYLPMVRATGEIHEYMAKAAPREGGKYESMNVHSDDQRTWCANVQDYLRRWAWEHRDERPDTWTPDIRKARDASGVWQ